MRRRLAIGLLCLLSAPALAQEPGTGGAASETAALSFFSFTPAKPQLPRLSVKLPWASDMSRAQDAYRKGDFVAARENLERAAANGDVIALWYLGHIWRLGRGVPVNDVKALTYYARVVEAFTPEESDPQHLRVMVDSLVRVADAYRSGNKAAEIAADPARAYAMYNTAASYGHPAAHYALGVMTLQGSGVKRNPETGLKWLMLAARKRYAPAEAALGELFWQGGDVQQDRVKGLMWYILADETATEDATISDRLTALTREATPAERAAAEARAKLWSQKHPANVIAAASLSGD